MRILAMDVGDKRIGMAVSDALGWTAQGIPTLERKNNKYDLEAIKGIMDKYTPQLILLGLPKNMNGTLGPQGEKVMALGEKLKVSFGIETEYWDERLTTVSAHNFLIEGNVRREKRKQKVDQVAAVLILQSYLDYINKK